MNHFHGFKIVVTSDSSKRRLSDGSHLMVGDYVTPAFRAEINAWLGEFFGFDNIVKEGNALVMPPSNTVFMNPRMFALLKATP